MNNIILWCIGCFGLIIILVACDPQKEILGPISPTIGHLDSIVYNPTTYIFPEIKGLPPMEVPNDNPLTVEGVRLGRFLFYEKMLSADFSISCGNCHQQNKAFTDGRAVAVGVGGSRGSRNSMSLINVGYNWKRNSVNNFNWDGRFASLEEQVLSPVEHPLEMKNHWDTVVARLQAHPHYPRLFRQAFGISNLNEITKELSAKAIAQFLRTLNSANSEYDRDEWVPFQYMNEAAQRGKILFIGDAAGSFQGKDGECAHCHSFTRNFAIFARNEFSNNALDSVGNFNEFADSGLGNITGLPPDNGRFREVSVRNVALTAPYMHDGRFASLEEVLDHYSSHANSNRGPNVAGELATAPTLPTLTSREKQDIIAFLHALTDSSYVNKAEWADPFLLADPWAE